MALITHADWLAAGGFGAEMEVFTGNKTIDGDLDVTGAASIDTLDLAGVAASDPLVLGSAFTVDAAGLAAALGAGALYLLVSGGE